MFYKVIPGAQKTEYKKYLSPRKKSLVKRVLTYNKSRYSLRTLFFNHSTMSVLTAREGNDVAVEASIDAGVLQQKTATAVALSVQVSEQADPGVRLRVAQEAQRRRRKTPR